MDMEGAPAIRCTQSAASAEPGTVDASVCPSQAGAGPSGANTFQLAMAEVGTHACMIVPLSLPHASAPAGYSPVLMSACTCCVEVCTPQASSITGTAAASRTSG